MRGGRCVRIGDGRRVALGRLRRGPGGARMVRGGARPRIVGCGRRFGAVRCAARIRRRVVRRGGRLVTDWLQHVADHVRDRFRHTRERAGDGLSYWAEQPARCGWGSRLVRRRRGPGRCQQHCTDRQTEDGTTLGGQTTPAMARCVEIGRPIHRATPRQSLSIAPSNMRAMALTLPVVEVLVSEFTQAGRLHHARSRGGARAIRSAGWHHRSMVASVTLRYPGAG